MTSRIQPAIRGSGYLGQGKAVQRRVATGSEPLGGERALPARFTENLAAQGMAFCAVHSRIPLHLIPRVLLEEMLSAAPRTRTKKVQERWLGMLTSSEQPALEGLELFDVRSLFTPELNVGEQRAVRIGLYSIEPFIEDPRSTEGRLAWSALVKAVEDELKTLEAAPGALVGRAKRIRDQDLAGAIAALVLADLDAVPPDLERGRVIEALQNRFVAFSQVR